MRRVHETIVALDKQQVLRISLCVCARWCVGSLACNCARARVALHMQHANRMRRVVLSSAPSLAPPYFSTFISLTARI